MVERCRARQRATPPEFPDVPRLAEPILSDRGPDLSPEDRGVEGIKPLPPEDSELLRSELPTHRQGEVLPPSQYDWN